jgi:nucleotide-binding universal stress UspA family protein
MAVASSVLAVPEFEDMNKTEALERARAGAELARKAGFAAEARTEVDTSTWDGIEAVADEIDAPVIVIGSRGLSGPRELFEGSVSRDVIRHSHRAVLVIPPPERPRRSAGG